MGYDTLDAENRRLAEKLARGELQAKDIVRGLPFLPAKRDHWLHRHRWTLVPAFTDSTGFNWPPMWACLCGQIRDVASWV